MVPLVLQLYLNGLARKTNNQNQPQTKKTKKERKDD